MANIPIFANSSIAKAFETSNPIVPPFSFAAQSTAKPEYC
jgi:hypothetical protein